MFFCGGGREGRGVRGGEGGVGKIDGKGKGGERNRVGREERVI